MIPLDKALEILDSIIQVKPKSEEIVPIDKSTGRHITQDACSAFDLPPFRRAMVDGYAVSSDEPSAGYKINGFIPAGKMPDSPINEGEAVKIMTGAPVPPGAVKVIMVEHTEETDGFIKTTGKSPTANITEIGSDIVKGDVIIKAGTRVKPLHAAVLKGCGLTGLKTAKRVKIAIVSTGDEIVETPEEITGAQIVNINGLLLQGLSEEENMEVTGNITVKDVFEDIESAIADAASKSDIIAVSGGVSMGDLDLVPDVLKKLGFVIHYHKIAILPGKPNLFASKGDKYAFCLPGNPLAVYVGFQLFIKRAMKIISGAKPAIRKVKVRLSGEFTRRSTERLQFVPGKFTEEGLICPVTVKSSAHLASLADFDGFFLIPTGIKTIGTDIPVEFIPKDGFQV
jgi:molybdopterin molybdotransferase